MNLDTLPARRKMFFLNLVKTGQALKYPINYANEDIKQMAKAGYFEMYDHEIPGLVVFRHTQLLCDAVATWNEDELRHQIESELPPGPVGGCEFAYA